MTGLENGRDAIVLRPYFFISYCPNAMLNH